MENLNQVLFYTLEKSIKSYRKFAQTRISEHGFDITIDQWLVLKTLQEKKHISQNQIAELVFKDIASITRIIDILVRKNYINRKPDVNDRRKFDLEITDEGHAIIQAVYPIVVENRKKALKGFKKNEISMMKQQLEMLINNCQS